ncbi:MAG: alpha/beta fold hydrolase [Bryobacteraceae bacterium]|nr:alpha/beta fold hydrolase [Bryobacteraceae bacterium]
MRELLFIHGAGGAVDDPEFGSQKLIAFLKRKLARDYRIRAPLMPTPEEPHAIAWLDALDAELFDFPDDGVLVGHSMGGAMILKWIAERKPSFVAAGLVMIACPFWGEPDWEVEEFYLPDAFADRLSGLKRILLYHSRDDAIVPFAHMGVYQKHIPRAEPHEVDGMGHTFARGDRRALVSGIRSL